MRTRVSDAVTRVLVTAVLVLTTLFLLGPAAIVVLLSFTGDSVLKFPPESWSTEQYSSLLASDTWGSTAWLSLRLAGATALLSVALAVPTSIVLHRSRIAAPLRMAVESAGLIALVLPLSAYAVALYTAFAQLNLLGTFLGLVIASLVISFPLTFLVVESALARLPRELELAAMTLGAGRVRAWLSITVRLLTPAIVAGGLLAFITAFDEAVFVTFLGGPGLITLPKAIYDSVQFEIDPAIAAISALIIAATAVIMVITNWLRKGYE